MRVLAESNRALANVRKWNNAQSSKSGILKKIGCLFTDCDALAAQLDALKTERNAALVGAGDLNEPSSAKVARAVELINEIAKVEDRIARCC